MSNILNKIVTVSIDISSPLEDSSSFDNLLIIGPAPKNKDNELPKVGCYASLSEITECGVVAIGDDADPIGVAARIAFSQSPPPSMIYMAYVDTEEITEDGETYTSFNETATDVLDKALETSGWYMVCPVDMDDFLLDIIQWTEAQEKMCCYTELDSEPSLPTIYLRSFGIFGKTSANQDEAEVTADNKCINVAWAAKTLNYSSGSETWAFKTLSAIEPTNLSSTQMKNLESQNVSYMVTTSGKNLTYCAKTLGGEWIDVMRFRDWLKNDMQINVANLFVMNPKVPYTDEGISLVEGKMIASLTRGVASGGIAKEEFDSDGNSIPSFVVSVPRSSNLTATEKASRTLSNCIFTARIAGAIHLTEIKGTLTYENL